MLRNTTKLSLTIFTTFLASACAEPLLDETTDDSTPRDPCGDEGSTCDDPPDEYPDSPGDDDDGGGGGGSCDGNRDCVPDLDELSIDVDLAVLGAGVFVGTGGACLLDVAGDFTASGSATVAFDGDQWLIVDVDEASVAFETASGCECSGISLSALASVEVSAELDASAATCAFACTVHAELMADAHCHSHDTACRAAVNAEVLASCTACCNLPGNLIEVRGDLTAQVVADVNGVLGLDAGPLDDLACLSDRAIDIELSLIGAGGAVIALPQPGHAEGP